MPVGCRSKNGGGLLCEEKCDFNQRLECSVSFADTKKSEKVIEECDYCTVDGDSTDDGSCQYFCWKTPTEK